MLGGVEVFNRSEDATLSMIGVEPAESIFEEAIPRALNAGAHRSLACDAGKPPKGTHWAYEVKWDGYRVAVHIEAGLGLRHCSAVCVVCGCE